MMTIRKRLGQGLLAAFLVIQAGAQHDVGLQSAGLPRQDFSFVNMDVRSAFKALSEVGQVDIVCAPNVKDEMVVMNLTEKTWHEAMQILCQMYQLKYVVEDNYLYVLKQSDYNKMMLENATAEQQTGAVLPLERVVIRLQHSKAVDLENALKALLSPRGKLNIVERNNAIIIYDTKTNLDDIKEAIRALDVETYQINIKAQLIQVNSDAIRSMGVDWQLGSPGDINPLLTNPGQLPTTPQAGGVVQSNPGGIVPRGGGDAGAGGGEQTGSVVGGIAGATAQMAFGLLDGNLSIAIAHLLNTSQAELIARPQITTLENKEATIFLGEEVPQRVVDQRGVPGFINQEAGTQLKVVPNVTGDGRVLLQLDPQKSSFRPNPSGGQFIIERQEASTTVLVNDGETVVIAGLTSKEETEVETGIPLLKDLPVIGYLFKHQRIEVRKKDLIIFITPHIVRSGDRMGMLNGNSSVPESQPLQLETTPLGSSNDEQEAVSDEPWGQEGVDSPW